MVMDNASLIVDSRNVMAGLKKSKARVLSISALKSAASFAN
jgi:hypothetical protein